ncbi:unnamed protein product [Microthlaspi erraticum]|uniref:Uncharacterized protein n=1 Tax=Microthlaspi erraticum TaxID=1685480 RepID=A0A6D2K9D7_9BRAS|nr:unnamed protein product [Microthlaspi erraticum]CAA7049690.1 unnamed protein product [Microthlaspi erraticum]
MAVAARALPLPPWFSVHPIRIPVMVNTASSSLAMGKGGQHQRKSSLCIDQENVASRNSVLMDEDSDDDDEFQIAESEQEVGLSKHNLLN